MTPVQIAYFKHFLYDKGIHRLYTDCYRKFRITGSPRGDKDGNPESLEKFFLETTVENVIMKAFTFYIARHFKPINDHDYWDNVNSSWLLYIRDNENNFSNDCWPLLSNTFSILRQNWDLPLYWKRDNFESTEEVYARMEISLPLPEFRWKHGYMPKSLAADETKEEEVAPENTTVPDSSDNELIEFVEDDDDPFAGFDAVEVSKGQSTKLRSNEISFNSNEKNTCHKITFNIRESIELKKSKMTFAGIASRDGDVFLIINNRKGVRVSYGDDNKTKRNVAIGSKDLCIKLKTLLGIKAEYKILTYEKIESSMTRIIYKLSVK